MRRALLLARVVAGLSAAVLLISFSVSRYNVRGQGYVDSPGDFLFMLSAYTALSLRIHPEALPSMERHDRELTWFSRAGGSLVRVLTRATLDQSAARMMFLDARQCYWIRDNLDERPFRSEREAAAMTAGSMSAGAWLLVILGAILGLPSI